MDEEYDVIVLGTGLTVSSQSGLICACTKTLKKSETGYVNFHVVINGQRVDTGPLSFLCSWLEVKRLPASQ